MVGSTRSLLAGSPPLAGQLSLSDFNQIGGKETIVARYSSKRKEAVLSKLLLPYKMTEGKKGHGKREKGVRYIFRTDCS